MRLLGDGAGARALTAAGLALALPGCSRPPAAAPPPSIVVVTIDTLRADRLGAYGHAAARTPALDALARRGVRFDAATTPFPRTTPALASMMTGLLPWRHGSREVGQPMRAAATVASVLEARGYRTLGVSVNGAAGPAQNLHLGFERFLDHESFPDHTAAGVTDAVLALLDGEPGRADTDAAESGTPAAGAPLFLWVHYIDPHFPYAPPADWEDQPKAPACRRLMAETGSDLAATAHVRIDLGGVASEALADCAALYDAEVAYTDHHLGRLLDGLAARGILPSAYLVVTSDHGENLGEDGLFYEHGPSLHDASLRVPLIVAGPGIERGVDAAPARLEDLAPTLLALAGVPAGERPPSDGTDLSPGLLRERGGRGEPGGRSGSSAPRFAVAESGGALLPQTFTYLASGRPGDLECVNGPRFSLCVEPGGGEARLYDHLADPFLEHDVSERHPEVREALFAVRRRWPPGSARERALRDARFKLVLRPRADGTLEPALYELASDPGETTNLAAAQPERVTRLRAELEAAFAGAETAPPPELDAREVEALRALGYVR